MERWPIDNARFYQVRVVPDAELLELFRPLSFHNGRNLVDIVLPVVRGADKRGDVVSVGDDESYGRFKFGC